MSKNTGEINNPSSEFETPSNLMPICLFKSAMLNALSTASPITLLVPTFCPSRNKAFKFKVEIANYKLRK